MRFKNCKKCGKLFNATSNKNMCASCNTDSLASFSVIRDFMYDNPGSNALEIVKAMLDMGLDVSTNDILGFIRNGSILYASDEENTINKIEPKSTPRIIKY